MAGLIKVREVQAALGAAYVVLAAAALLRAPSVGFSASAFGLLLGAYLTGRTSPDACIPADQIFRVGGLGAMVILAGLAAQAIGGPGALGWASVVMAYCAGNRLKAAGLGIRRGGQV